MTKLREYLFYKNTPITQFAKKLNVSGNYMNRIVLGRDIPSARLAKDIQAATNGEVTIADLRPEKKEDENGS